MGAQASTTRAQALLLRQGDRRARAGYRVAIAPSSHAWEWVQCSSEVSV
jgi:hypothetical protein